MEHERMKQLLAAEQKLKALEAAGVDNWEGYGEAMRSIGGDNTEETEEEIYGDE